MLKLGPGSFRFERFVLDPANRELRRDAAPVALNARYLDALTLLVREHGRLVTKERFLEEVWRGVPVTDEALTQCIRTLRKQLGDDAANPRFIETAPKHGYRFVAAVEPVDGERAVAAPREAARPAVLPLGVAGTVGGGIAGALGGLVYGLVGVAEPAAPGVGASSALLVFICLTLAIGLVGGAGVAFGIAAAGGRRLAIVGGAVGGLAVGAAAKLVGTDAFNLLFGRAPGDMTGAPEGAVLGAAVGLGLWLGGGSVRRGAGAAALAGAAAGVAIPLLGGRLMGGSLAGLASRFPDSRLRLDHLGGLFGESGFGPVGQAVTGGLEGALFCACVAGAMILARQRQALAGDNYSH